MADDRIKTVIFGGSFDPIHVGHITLAKEVIKQKIAQEVWFMVTPQNPHKRDKQLTDEKERLRMVQIAVEGEPRFQACDFEFSLPRPSYTLHTLNALEKKYPERKFILLVGADNWEKFNSWYKGDEIVERFGLVVYPRDNENTPSLPANVIWLKAQLCNISSTQIRNIIASGDNASIFLPSGVNNYIIEKDLYKR